MQWLYENGFTILREASVPIGLLFTAFTIWLNARERRIQNQFLVNNAHRDIWSLHFTEPALRRVLKTDFPDSFPVPTLEERLFVRFLIHHLAATFRAKRYGMYFDEAGLAADLAQFFAKPIPRAVWKDAVKYQEPEFVAFVEQSLHSQMAQKAEM